MAVLSTDPLVFARDDCNDLIIPLRIARGLEAVAVLVRSAVALFADEYFLNRDKGVRWLPTSDGVVSETDAILGQPFDPAKLQREIRRVVLSVTAVGSISEFRASFDGVSRTVKMSFVVHTAFGDQQLTIALPLPA